MSNYSSILPSYFWFEDGLGIYEVLTVSFPVLIGDWFRWTVRILRKPRGKVYPSILSPFSTRYSETTLRRTCIARYPSFHSLLASLKWHEVVESCFGEPYRWPLQAHTQTTLMHEGSARAWK